jgi:hypothetical protein
VLGRDSDGGEDDDDDAEATSGLPPRSFSALNLTSKATKLASNLKRKMSDQVNGLNFI